MRAPVVTPAQTLLHVKTATPAVLHARLVRLWCVIKNKRQRVLSSKNGAVVVDACCDVLHELLQQQEICHREGCSMLLEYILRRVISMKLRVMMHVRAGDLLTVDYGETYWPGREKEAASKQKAPHIDEPRRVCIYDDKIKGRVIQARTPLNTGTLLDYMNSEMRECHIKTRQHYDSNGRDGMYAIELGGTDNSRVVLDPAATDIGVGALAEDFRDIDMKTGVANTLGKRANCELMLFVSVRALRALYC